MLGTGKLNADASGRPRRSLRLVLVAVILGGALAGGLLGRDVTPRRLRPAAFALSADESRLFVALSGVDELIAVDSASGRVLERATTGVLPIDVAILPARGEVWVVNRFAAGIDVFRAADLVRLGSITVPTYCERLVADRETGTVYVTNSAQSCVFIIDAAHRAEVGRIKLPGAMPRDVLLDRQNSRLYVAQFHSESIAIVDLDSHELTSVVRVGALPSGLSIVGDSVAVGHLGLTGSTADDAITNCVSLIDRQSGVLRHTFPLALATPVATAAGPNDRSLWIACLGSDALVEVDVHDGGLGRRVNVGAAPTDVCTSPDGRLFVANRLDDRISVTNPDGSQVTWPLAAYRADASSPVERGERLFHRALGRGANTCYSCHPDGQTDGLSRFIAPPHYLGSPVINTPSLQSVRWTPPYRRDASVASVSAHLANIMPIMHGGEVSDRDVRDIAAYLDALPPQPNPFEKSVEQLSASERQGRRLFAELRCATCHWPGLYTDHRTHNVGTGGDADTPSLLNLWQTGPFLHDGRAATLADVFAPQTGRHEPPIESESERAALAAYLLTLPNPSVFASAPAHLAVGDGGRLELQVLDPNTGRPIRDARPKIERVQGPKDVTLGQPAPTDDLGQTHATVRGASPGSLRLRVTMSGEAVAEVRPIDLFVLGKSFVNVAAKAGVDFRMPPNAYPRAVAIGDYDADGYPDVFVAVSGKDPKRGPNGPHVGAPSVLLRNRGNGTFEDATRAAGLYRPDRSSAGAAWGDYDNDGDLDLFVANRGGPDVPASIDELFRNNGDGTFSEVAGAAGVANRGFGYSVLWFDYDHDGDVDLYVENLTACCSDGNTTPDALYRNNGDGTFADVTVESGLSKWAAFGGDGGAVGDYDGDGWQDVLKIATDDPHRRYYLLRNERDGTFTERSADAGLGEVTSSRGLVFGDFDNDTDLDLFVVGRGLFRNDGARGAAVPTVGERSFTDVTPEMGFDFAPYAGRRFGHTIADLDNDGWLDIVAENRNERLAIFLNQQGTGRFRIVDDTDTVLDASPDPKVGLGVLDYDLDGDLDIFLGKEGDTFAGGQPQALFENRLGTGHHFLRVTLVGSDPRTPRFANGARIYVEAGALRQMREITAGENASGCADHTQHFGLDVAGAVERMTVQWPSGRRDVYGGIAADQHIRITEGQAEWSVVRTLAATPGTP